MKPGKHFGGAMKTPNMDKWYDEIKYLSSPPNRAMERLAEAIRSDLRAAEPDESKPPTPKIYNPGDPCPGCGKPLSPVKHNYSVKSVVAMCRTNACCEHWFAADGSRSPNGQDGWLPPTSAPQAIYSPHPKPPGRAQWFDYEGDSYHEPINNARGVGSVCCRITPLADPQGRPWKD